MLSLEKTRELLEFLLSNGIINENTKESIFKEKSISDIETDISINFPDSISSQLIYKLNIFAEDENKYTPIINILNNQIITKNFEEEKTKVFGHASNDFMIHSKEYEKRHFEKMCKNEKERDKQIQENNKKIDAYQLDIKRLKQKRKHLKHLK